MSEGFTRLLGFESRELVESYFLGLHGRTLSASRARSIVSSFRQGRILFDSAAATETLARPITQFYGVSALSRGLAIALRRDGSEEALSRGHGLAIKSFSAETSELEIHVTRGLFADLTAALGGATVRVRHGAPDWFLPLPDVEPGAVLALSKVARLIPSLAGELRQWTDFDPRNDFALESCDSAENDTKRRWRFSGRGDDGLLHREFGSQDATVNGSVVVAHADFVPQVAQSFVFDKIGNLLIREPLADNIRLGPLQAMFIVSYALSMLARYRPSQWMEVLSGAGRDRMFPFVQAFLGFNQNWFPQLAADHLQFAARCDRSMIPDTRER